VHVQEKPYTCQVCQKDFGNNGSLKINMEIHKAPEERPKCICNICQKEFVAGWLKNHIQMVHEKPTE